MTAEVIAERELRAARHRALGDPLRLALTDALTYGDATPGQLRAALGIDWNLLSFHLGVLERAGLVSRSSSEGDGRRRYVRLVPQATEPSSAPAGGIATGVALFVCTHNAARSQFAAALWRSVTGGAGHSAGTDPAETVHPLAVETAVPYGLDLSGARPQGYDEAPGADLVVSVCDRARESGVPAAATSLHWSVPAPVGGNREAFERAFADIADRVERLAGAAA